MPPRLGEIEGHDAFAGSCERADMLEADVPTGATNRIDFDSLPMVVTAI
jgi:hypothetical protein